MLAKYQICYANTYVLAKYKISCDLTIFTYSSDKKWKKQ